MDSVALDDPKLLSLSFNSAEKPLKNKTVRDTPKDGKRTQELAKYADSSLHLKDRAVSQKQPHITNQLQSRAYNSPDIVISKSGEDSLKERKQAVDTNASPFG